MEMDDAVVGFGCLSTPSRIRVLQVLSKAGKEGMPSGEIAKALDVPTNTLSTQLLLLSNARLVKSRRDGRQIIYWVNLEALRDLIDYVAQECANGRLKGSMRVAG